MNNPPGFIVSGDRLIVAVIIFLAVLTGWPLFIPEPAGDKRVMIVGTAGELFSLPFSELAGKGRFTREFIGDAGLLVFEFDPDKGVRVTATACPDKICLRTSYIKGLKQTIVCLPGRIYATIKDSRTESGEPDAILR